MGNRSWTLKPQTGTVFQVDAGDVVRVTDIEGEQVSDVVAFSADDLGEWLSSGRSIDYNGTLYLTTGHTLYSNRSRPMFGIERDDVGRHDFLLAPCSPEMFRLLHGHDGHHPSCLENLAVNLEPYGISIDRIPTAFNVFMNAEVQPDGRIVIGPPLSHAGDVLELRAKMRLIVAATACSAEQTNNGTLKPIRIEVISPRG